MWPELIRKAKEGGLNAIETYVFWNAHEPNRRQYNFEGRFDLVRFLKTIQEEGLYSILRIGPYVCAEWNYGLTRATDFIVMVSHRTTPPVLRCELKTGSPRNLNQPKWGHLKELHEALLAMENALLYGDANHTDHGNISTNYSANGVAPGCFLSNIDAQKDYNLSFNGNTYFLPAWSVSVLPDCKTEAHNTAKINVQTSLMVRLSNKAESEPSDLSWSWTPEIIGDVLQGNGGHFKTNQLKEQLSVTTDASDYLWYMTRVYLDPKGPNFSNQMTLRVNTRGHGLYAYVNGELVGSQYSTSGNYSFVFEETVNVKAGFNYITLLSVTNYGAFYDKIPVGINGGPVELVTGNTTWDLSSNEWSYKIGLDGETKQIFTSQQIKWLNDNIQGSNRRRGRGSGLNGMGKGAAWVNGEGIGRYHGPRSFLQDDDNTLVLFEEAGGDPLQVSFQTITMGTVCADLEEGHTMNLACQGGHTIGSVGFASFGDPQGTCGGFSEGTCNGVDALAIVEEACVGKTECSIDVNEEMFGSVDCGGITRRLAVQAKCV
ncbi:Beta-galactosidase 15 [Acorus calamus]|uniref:beta-galactosidase n=1 Tax=Acorus calamus TaxID=4465 RepID=A0AAV9E6R5_ACOCL|nr:Beta-galactosidase 15 [Acorus calamus]